MYSTLKNFEILLTLCHMQIGLYWPVWAFHPQQLKLRVGSIFSTHDHGCVMLHPAFSSQPTYWSHSGCGEAYIANCPGAFFPGIWVAPI